MLAAVLGRLATEHHPLLPFWNLPLSRWCI